MTAAVELCTQGLQRALAFEAEQAARSQLRTLLESSEQLISLDDPERVAETVTNIAASRIGPNHSGQRPTRVGYS